MTDDLLARARAWHDMDPDPVTGAELADLIADAAAGVDEAVAELHDRFDTRLAFGTAGLRGRLAAGPNRMNRVLVAQAAAGLGAWLSERTGGHPAVVIGYDGRVNSDVFARDSAELFAGAGLRAILLPRPMPTPVLAFAVRHLDAAAGVMVTASHNPPRDNGYKVYLGGDDQGSQIVPPVDGEIAAHILRIADAGPITALPRSYDYGVAGDEVLDAYVAATAAAVGDPGGADLHVVFSAMHGVGWESLARVFDALGMPEPTTVPAQIEPDGAFPTVAFPNPEEPGAMDLSFALAGEVDADLVVVNDPDADRLAVGIPDAAQPGGWRRLTGNEVGGLLGWEAAERARSAGRDGGVLAASIVSSPLLAEIARAYGFAFAETLTRVQVGLAGARPGLRLRGGARLSRRSGGGARQGRRLGRGTGGRERASLGRRRSVRREPPRRDGGPLRGVRERSGVDPRHRPVAHRRADGGAPGRSAHRAGRLRGGAHRRPPSAVAIAS